MRPQRILTAPAETTEESDLTSWPGVDLPTLSATGHTGAYKYQFDNTEAHGWALAAAEESIRAGAFVQHGGIGSNNSGRLIAFGDDDGIAEIVLDDTTSEIWIVYDGDIVARADFPSQGPQTAGIWHHIGLYTQTPAAGRAGRITFYHNSRPIIAYSGASAPATIDQFYFGGAYTGSAWLTAYIDDLYIDRVPAGADHAPPVLRLAGYLPNDDGTYSLWTPEPGGNDNYQNVSEDPHDGDSSYNHASTTNLSDRFVSLAPSTPTDYEPAGAAVFVYARDDAGAGSPIALRVADADGQIGTETIAALSAGYARHEAHFAETPAGEAWAGGSFADLEFGYSS